MSTLFVEFHHFINPSFYTEFSTTEPTDSIFTLVTTGRAVSRWMVFHRNGLVGISQTLKIALCAAARFLRNAYIDYTGKIRYPAPIG